MIYEVAKALLFHLDAEAAHDLVTRQMARAQSVPLLLRAVRRAMFASCAPRELWGLRFANPFGIAAGFDKNAELIPMLTALGFGFVEVGTVTLLPQPGNPKPRMFRYPEHEALVNRLGFNNEGAAHQQFPKRLICNGRLNNLLDLRPHALHINGINAPIHVAE